MTRSGEQLCWRLLYTKPRAEAWVEMNLRRQGYETLLPLVKERSGVGALFPRYVFVAVAPEQDERPLRSTRGVQYVVCSGEKAARVPREVVNEVRGRTDAHEVVRLDSQACPDSLFANRQRDRTLTLIKLAQAGYRVRAA